MFFHDLIDFLLIAKKSTYAAGDFVNKIKESDNSTTIIFEDWSWKYHDNYFWGEPYGGREVVFFQWNPVWMMTYYGWVIESIDDPAHIYTILQEALLRIPSNAPYRGPEEYRSWEYEYSNTFSGGIDNFQGTEIITHDWLEIYKASYMGGFVDKKR